MSTSISVFRNCVDTEGNTSAYRDGIHEFQGYYDVYLCRALNCLCKNKSSLKHICVIEVCLCDKGNLDTVCREDFGGLLGR